MHRKVAIIGAGPAGIACAIQLKLAGVDFYLFEEKEVAWNLKNANLIENYPALSPVRGVSLSNKMKSHLKRLNINVKICKIKKCLYKGKKFYIKTPNYSVTSDCLVICTGTTPKRIPDFEIKGKTFYDVYSLSFSRRKKIAIIGSGEAAFDSALSIAKNKNKVTIFARKNSSTFISKKLIERVKKNSFINVYRGEDVKSVINKNNVLCLKRGSKIFAFDFLLILIGRKPNLPIIVPKNIKERVYLCGSVKYGRLGQTAMAIGDGISAAMEIIWKYFVPMGKKT